MREIIHTDDDCCWREINLNDDLTVKQFMFPVGRPKKTRTSDIVKSRNIVRKRQVKNDQDRHHQITEKSW